MRGYFIGTVTDKGISGNNFLVHLYESRSVPVLNRIELRRAHAPPGEAQMSTTPPVPAHIVCDDLRV